MKRLILTAAAVLVILIVAAVHSYAWNAVAWNEGKDTWGYGQSDDLGTAQREALQQAGMPGASVWLWTESSCLAVAVDGFNTKRAAMMPGKTMEEAEARAVERCMQTGGRNCRMKIGGCNPR